MNLARIRWPGVRGQFVAVMVVTSLVFAASALAFLQVFVVDALQTATRETYAHLLRILASDIGDLALTGRNFDLQLLLFETTERDPHLEYLVVTDSKGEMIASSYGSQIPTQLRLVIAEAEKESNGSSSEPLLVRDRGRDLFHLRVDLLGGRAGSLHAGVEEDSIHANAIRIMLNLVLLFLALTTAGVVVAVSMGRVITEPLRQMADLARRIGSGDLSGRIPVSTDDEVGELGTAFNDMSAKLRASHKALIRSERLAVAGGLAAGVAHEINNPLASLQACVWALRRPDLSEDARDRHLDSLSKELNRIARTVQQLLRFARPPRTNLALVPFVDLVERTVHLVRPSLPEDRIAIELDLQPDLPRISVDRDQIEQVLLNLLLNAARAIKETNRPGKITVRLRRTAAGQVLEVADDGPGIPQEDLDRVFDPFFTGHAHSEGTGLGLSVSQGFAEAHGGTLTLQPAPGGKGVLARLSLPDE